jgi:hypothetical protein
MDVLTCRLCGAALPDDGGLRCTNCGLHKAADLDRPGYRRLVLGLVSVYALTALLVLLARG